MMFNHKDNQLISSPGTPLRICAFGEMLWDVIDGNAHLGGAPFNFAAHAARLGVEPYLVSRVGDDPLGADAVAQAQTMGVKTPFVGIDPNYPTGTVDVRVSRNGQPTYDIGFPAAWDFIDVSAHQYSDLQSAGLSAIYFGTLAQRHAVSRSGLQSLLQSLPDVPLFFDLNLRQDYYTREVIRWGMDRATIVKMNDDECRCVAKLLLDRNLSVDQGASVLRETFKITILLITLGAKGCLVLDDSGISRVPGHPVLVADTVGAGDAFSAAFLTSWLRGESLACSATTANLIGAYVASKSGAVPEYGPDLEMQLGVMSPLDGGSSRHSHILTNND